MPTTFEFSKKHGGPETPNEETVITRNEARDILLGIAHRIEMGGNFDIRICDYDNITTTDITSLDA